MASVAISFAQIVSVRNVRFTASPVMKKWTAIVLNVHVACLTVIVARLLTMRPIARIIVYSAKIVDFVSSRMSPNIVKIVDTASLAQSRMRCIARCAPLVMNRSLNVNKVGTIALDVVRKMSGFVRSAENALMLMTSSYVAIAVSVRTALMFITAARVAIAYILIGIGVRIAVKKETFSV